MKREMRGAPDLLRSETAKRSEVKCCICRDPVLMSGWCDNCQRWPINVTPIRFCERGHRVDPDGLCMTCGSILLSRLDPRPGEWVDTGEVANLLPREENHRRLKALMATFKTWGRMPVVRKAQPISEAKQAELDAEHAEVRRRMQEREGKQNAEERNDNEPS